MHFKKYITSATLHLTSAILRITSVGARDTCVSKNNDNDALMTHLYPTTGSVGWGTSMEGFSANSLWKMMIMILIKKLLMVTKKKILLGVGGLWCHP